MMDPERILGGLIRQGIRSGLRGRRSRRSSIGGVLGTGAVGLGILGIAIAAFDHYTQSKAPRTGPNVPPPPGPAPGNADRVTPPPPPPAADASPPAGPKDTEGTTSLDQSSEVARRQALLLIRAMIAAANADGQIDSQERKAILGRLAEAGLGDEDRDFVLKELETPSSVEDILSAADSPELARHIYAVSLLAIDVDTQDEKDYLHYLQLRLGLDDRVVAETNRQLGLDEKL
jgi:uncharacterized membrane protein YebE (DUF533 family)